MTDFSSFFTEMRFSLDGIEVFFPYEYMYPEQYTYMLELKRTLDAKGHGLLEMPTGTGKTVCLLSLITSYQLAHPEMGKLIYCTRTVPEMTKCILELKQVIDYRDKMLGTSDGTTACVKKTEINNGDNNNTSINCEEIMSDGLEGKDAELQNQSSTFLALCLSSRRNLCINPTVMATDSDRDAVDSLCRDRTSSWVRAKAAAGDTSVETCSFFEEYSNRGSDSVVPSGIYSLDDLKTLGQQQGWCPYFLARHVINHAKVLVYNYQYMLDPKVSKMVSAELESESVVVFDEAHNIDNVCIEALSVSLDQNSIEQSAASVQSLNNRVATMERENNQRLKDEYARLCSSLTPNGAAATDTILANPMIPDDLLEEQMPGNIRKAKHFVSMLNNLVHYMRSKLGELKQDADAELPGFFLHWLEERTQIDKRSLKFTYTRLNSLLRTLEVTQLDDFNALQDLADFVTLVATYSEGFSIVLERNGSVIPGVYEPVMQLACLDASLAIKPVFDRFSSVIITSGTLSPLDLYPKLLGFHPVVRVALDMSTFRECICPVVVTRGNDQVQLSTRYEVRDDAAVFKNYGELLLDLSGCVPDGVVCFFTSYMYMEKAVEAWHNTGILEKVLEKKLVFIETKDVLETTLALNNYKRACNCGRGAVFLSVARGKVAEGIDFDGHYGRCVVLMGVPYQYTLSYVLRERLNYLRAKFQVRAEDFLTFDAMRQAAQCVGRVMRSKNDYGAMIFADSRYNRHDKRSKLPKWIQQFMRPSHLNVSNEGCIDLVRGFLKEMSQPPEAGAVQQILLDNQTLQSRSSTSSSSSSSSLSSSSSSSSSSSLSASSSSSISTTKRRPDEAPTTLAQAEDCEKRPRFEYLE